MNDRQVSNAIITGTMLGEKDHGIFTAFVYVEFSGGGHGFGGYNLGRFVESETEHVGTRVGTAYGMEFIKRTMFAVGVFKWEDLKGKHVRISHTREKILAIGHIINDVWFDPSELADEYADGKGGCK